MRQGFRTALDEHLAAIRARDIERFARTVSRRGDARVIGPTGHAIVGGEAIVAAHRDWFAAPSRWEFRPRVVWTRDSPEMGIALLDVDYEEWPASGDRGSRLTRFLLAVVFAWEDGGWRLIYDQNTGLAGPEAAERAAVDDPA